MKKTRDQKIKEALADACEAILAAIQHEDGLDGASGNRVLFKILRLFKTPFPPVNRGQVEDCPFTGKHNFSECGLDIPLKLSGKGFELK